MKEESKYILNHPNQNSTGDALHVHNQINEDSERDLVYVDFTSVDNKLPVDYIKILTGKLNIFRRLNLNLLDKSDAVVRNDVLRFLQSFAEIILENESILKNLGHLPSLQFNTLDDGSAIIEWGSKDFKIGFSFELDRTESSYYVIASDKFQDLNVSGQLDLNEISPLLNNIIQFVSINT